MKAKLGVNIDHIATLRQLRGTPYPDLLEAAMIVENAGAEQITVHLREDRRHIQDADVVLLRKHLKSSLNLEMAVSPAIVKFALKVKPDWICLVPEKRQEVTTEGGLNVEKHKKVIASIIQKAHANDINVSLFVEPSKKTVKLSAELGADAVEIHTGRYCMARQGAFKKNSEKIAAKELEKIIAAGLECKARGIHAHAGHGFDYENIHEVVKLGIFEEYNIGHAIVCRAVTVGLEQAVREMKEALQ